MTLREGSQTQEHVMLGVCGAAPGETGNGSPLPEARRGVVTTVDGRGGGRGPELRPRCWGAAHLLCLELGAGHASVICRENSSGQHIY